MAVEIIKTTFKLKRGTAARWAEVNPILEQGEPGFVYDTNQLKIGDGKTPWNNLPYIQGESGVINYNYSSDFPENGNPNVIYKSSEEQCLYQFDPETKEYEKLSDGSSLDNINLINGGNA